MISKLHFYEWKAHTVKALAHAINSNERADCKPLVERLLQVSLAESPGAIKEAVLVLALKDWPTLTEADKVRLAFNF